MDITVIIFSIVTLVLAAEKHPYTIMLHRRIPENLSPCAPLSARHIFYRHITATLP